MSSIMYLQTTHRSFVIAMHFISDSVECREVLKIGSHSNHLGVELCSHLQKHETHTSREKQTLERLVVMIPWLLTHNVTKQNHECSHHLHKKTIYSTCISKSKSRSTLEKMTTLNWEELISKNCLHLKHARIKRQCRCMVVVLFRKFAPSHFSYKRQIRQMLKEPMKEVIRNKIRSSLSEINRPFYLGK